MFQKMPVGRRKTRSTRSLAAAADGERIDVGDECVAALHTPGHSPDHLAFWHEPSRTVFTGDLVVLGSSVMIHGAAAAISAQYLASLERLLALEPRAAAAGARPAIDDPQAVLTGYLEHRRMRERQVLDGLRAGHATGAGDRGIHL